jgi:hypothetical protein
VSDDGKVWRLKRERDASSSRQPTIGKLPCYNIKKPRPNRRKYDVSWWATEEKSASPVDRNFSSQFIPSWKWGGGESFFDFHDFPFFNCSNSYLSLSEKMFLLY